MPIWEEQRVPDGFWNDPTNRRAYMQWLENKLGIQKEEDWYDVVKADFVKSYGATLINTQYVSSVLLALKEYKPEYDWLEWKVSKGFGLPADFWNNSYNRRRYMKWLGEQLGYQKEEDWYQITQSDFYKHGGRELLNEHYVTSYAAVKEFLGDHVKGWLFKKSPNAFWADERNRHAYMEWLGEQLGFVKPEDWYAVQYADFQRHNGASMVVHQYNGSAIQAVKSFIPHYDWQEWLFSRTTSRFWNNEENHSKYMAWLGEKLGFNKPEDWYRLTAQDFIKNNGHSLLIDYYYGSPPLAVIKFITDYKWDMEKFSVGVKKQKRLYNIVKKLFPNDEVKWNYSHQEMRFKDSNKPMQLDIFIPSKQIAIEYQGEQHFFPIEAWGGQKTLDGIKRRDAEKRLACAKNNLLLVEVDYTWNGTTETIVTLFLR